MNILLANLTKMVNDSGGLAKVTCSFANEMKRRGHMVSLVYSDIQTGEFYYSIDQGIPAYDIRHYKGQSISFPWYLKVKRELLRVFSKQKARTVNDDFAAAYLLRNLSDVLTTIYPDIIISFQPAASKMFLCDLQTQIPVITMSHGDPEDYFYTYPKEQLPALEKSAVCQVLVPAFEQSLHEHLKHVRTVVIGNAIPQYNVQADVSGDKDRHKILFVGRLSKNHKRPHLLIEAFADLADKFLNWDIELWGEEDGKLYLKELYMLIHRYGLDNRVFIKGSTKDVPSVLVHGDIFAFPSAYEGFGMALGEAMSMGLPGIAYSSCKAVQALIKDGENGLLCEDGVLPFRDGLEKLMENPELRKYMGENARRSMKKFAPSVIWDSWESLIEQTIHDNESLVSRGV